ncbi:MAG: hypothetical protein ACK55I_19860, partial [bacterium]
TQRREVMLLHGFIAGVLRLVQRCLPRGNGPVRRVAQAWDAAEEAPFLKLVRLKKSDGASVIAQGGGKGTIRAEAHDRAGATTLLRLGE